MTTPTQRERDSKYPAMGIVADAFKRGHVSLGYVIDAHNHALAAAREEERAGIAHWIAHHANVDPGTAKYLHDAIHGGPDA